MEALRHFEAVYADWEKRVKDEGRDEGLRQGERAGLVKSIEMLCDAFELEISGDRRVQLEACDIGQLEKLFAAISTTRRWPDS